MADDNIGARARTAVGWRALSQFSSQGIQIVTSIILARLLMPDDFGIIGMAGIVTGLAGVFRDLGFGQALVQRPELGEEHKRSAFWVTLIMAGLLYVAIYLAAPYAGEYFRDERMVPVLRIMALSFLISPFGVVPRSLLQRELDFKRPFIAGLAGTIVSGGVGITCAVLGYGYWSLVWALLASSAIGTVAICIITRYVPPLIPSLRGSRDLLSFGAGATGVGIMNYAAQKIDYLVVGRWLDSTALGLYTRAFTLVHAPLGVIGGLVSSVLFPVFASLQGDPQRAKNVMGRVLTGVSALAFPALAIFAVSAPELIPLLLGPHWGPSVLPAQIMAGAGALRVLANPAAMLPKGFGAVNSQVWRNGVYAATLFGGAVFGSRWGILGVAWATLAATVVIWSLNAQLLYACSGFGLRDYAHAIREPLLISLLAVSLSTLARSFLLARDNDPWIVLGGTLAVGLVVASAIMWGPCPRCRAVGREMLSIRRGTEGGIAAHDKEWGTR